MDFLAQLFGPPHESLHLLALRLIGREAVSSSDRHVDIPSDLTTMQYVFVAGLPALVFWGVALLGAILLASFGNLARVLLALLLLFLGTLGGLGTVGDIQLILMRLAEDQRPPD